MIIVLISSLFVGVEEAWVMWTLRLMWAPFLSPLYCAALFFFLDKFVFHFTCSFLCIETHFYKFRLGSSGL